MHLPKSPSLLTLGLSYLSLAPRATATVTWLYPPSSSSRRLSFNYNDLVYFTWESNFSDPTITLWCASASSYYNVFSTAVPKTGTTAQSFPYGQSFNQSCHMSLYCHNDTLCGPVGQSAEFGLEHDPSAAAQTWGAAATASIGKSVPTSSPSPLTTPPPPSSPAASAAATTASARPTSTVPTPRPESGLSTSAKAGIGLGTIVGVVTVVMGSWLVVAWVRRKRGVEREEGFGFGSSSLRDKERGGMMMMMTAAEVDGVNNERQEMDGEGRVGELGGTARAELGGGGGSPAR